MQPGSLVEYIGNGQWWCQNSGQRVNGPDKGEINTHDGEDPTADGYILLAEYPSTCDCGCGGSAGMPARLFREVQPPMDVSIESIIYQHA